MIESKTDNYPFWIVILASIVSFSIYGLGIIIMFQLGWIVSLLFLIYILVLEYKLIKTHCVNCFYWGKICGFGKGKLSSMFFKKGDASQFCINEIAWKNIIPDLLVSVIPVITGSVLIIIKFDYFLLIAVILLLILSTLGNGFIRSTLICIRCKQREIDCPAEKLFSKNKK